MNRRAPQTVDNNPGGSILVCVLGCLVVVTALVSSMTNAALQTRREMRAQHRLRQVELLLEAGVSRAVRRLSTDADFAGEVWQLSETTLPLVDQAQVTITASSTEDPRPRQVTVVAQLSLADHVQVTRSYRFPTSLTPSPPGETSELRSSL